MAVEVGVASSHGPIGQARPHSTEGGAAAPKQIAEPNHAYPLFRGTARIRTG